MGYSQWRPYHPTFIHFDTIPTCAGQTNREADKYVRQTNRQKCC